jgi:hypothetical protein
MAAPRKVFRIELSGGARSERPASEADESRDGAILRELSALRVCSRRRQPRHTLTALSRDRTSFSDLRRSCGFCLPPFAGRNKDKR